MPGDAALLGFIAAALVVLVMPGPGVFYIVARSIGQGLRAGLVSVLGLSVGALFHVVAATAGLSALLLASASAFTVVKALGVVYLIYLGLRTWFAHDQQPGTNATSARSLRRLFADGVAVSVLNPKIAIFFLAFLPQFTDPQHGSVPQQVLFLGLLYVGLALITDSAYALMAGSARRWLGLEVMRGPALRFVSGAVFIGLGITAAFSDRR